MPASTTLLPISQPVLPLSRFHDTVVLQIEKKSPVVWADEFVLGGSRSVLQDSGTTFMRFQFGNVPFAALALIAVAALAFTVRSEAATLFYRYGFAQSDWGGDSVFNENLHREMTDPGTSDGIILSGSIEFHGSNQINLDRFSLDSAPMGVIANYEETYGIFIAESKYSPSSIATTLTVSGLTAATWSAGLSGQSSPDSTVLYSLGPIQEPIAVPEPSFVLLTVLSCLASLHRKRD